MNLATLDCINAFKNAVTIGFVETRADLIEVQALRHQVFCREHTILDGHDGLESDRFDGHARHVVIRQQCGRIVATARLVPCDPHSPMPTIPMQLVCSPDTFIGLPMATTAEVSRFAISRERRSLGGAADHLLRVGLMRGILELSRTLGVTHWCAAMEVSLLRLLRYASIRFEGVGPAIDYRGWRQPAVAQIDMVLERGRREQPLLWDYVTDGGRLHGIARAGAAAPIGLAA